MAVTIVIDGVAAKGRSLHQPVVKYYAVAGSSR